MGPSAVLDQSILAFILRQIFSTIPANPADLRLTGRRFLLSGANSGIGFACAKQLLSYGASLLLVVRTENKGNDTKTRLLAEVEGSKEDQLQFAICDSGDFPSILAFGETLTTLPGRLDGAILNAGIQEDIWGIAPSGYETGLQVNVIAPALLSLLLIPVLQQTKERNQESGDVRSRLVFVTSESHTWTTFAKQKIPSDHILDYLNDKSRFDGTYAYLNSKLLAMSFARKLAEKITDITITITTPSLCKTSMVETIRNPVAHAIFNWCAREPEMGARALVHAIAVAPPTEAHGTYYRYCKPATPASFLSTTKGRRLGEALWNDLLRLFEELKPGVTAVVTQKEETRG